MLKDHFRKSNFMTVTIYIILLILFTSLQNLYLKSIQRDLEADAVFFASEVKAPMAAGKYQEVGRVVQDLSRQFYKSITVINTFGNRIAEVGEFRERDLPLEGILKGKNYVDKNAFQILISRQFSAAVPILFENKIHGAVVVGLPPDEVNKILWINLLFFFTVFFGILRSVLLLKKVDTHIIKPISTMIEVSRNFAAGNFTRTVHVNSLDEIGQLSKELNLLAKKLRITLEELNEKTAGVEDLLAGIVDGIIVVDAQRRVMLINPAACKLVGADSEKSAGKKLISIIRNYQLDEAVKKTLKEGSPYFKEIVLLPREQILKVHITPIKDRAGRISGSVIVMRDITELKHLEKLRSEFLANVSHELRTPLTSIKGFVETLLEGAYKDPGLAKRFLSIIDAEAGRLYRLINNLMDLSKIETNQLKLRIEDVSAAELINEVIIIFENRLKEKGLKFSTDIPKDLPKVKADPDWLRQVFINLLDNAIKYTQSGGRVWIEAEPKGDVVEFRVCDTGIGIPEEDLPRVFERFYRVDKARSPEMGGSGLGLAIVKHIVRAFGGDIRVESRVNQGSKFIFTLKRSK
ncbi:two-component system histidine kinase PnpS [Thermosediminibacter oceani]|uniref:histidine kinase n=1 Tax=Thermosediminibacter oceani (strain ATCC BAA-1034 / DSM 16646 / JW/IW-1228P) TaxID=555079 RepID=D9S2V3_THEOJ|nr:ATP-binding protein [Thermosediminibacter oceani]ADL07730.1 multi-sensor signal transduction histidine kinase [Thermosediminibacter oceani DSM 16646]